MVVFSVRPFLLSALPKMLEITCVLPAIDQVTIEAGSLEAPSTVQFAADHRGASTAAISASSMTFPGKDVPRRSGSRLDRSDVLILNVPERLLLSALVRSRRRRRAGRPGLVICNVMSRSPSAVKQPRD